MRQATYWVEIENLNRRYEGRYLPTTGCKLKSHRSNFFATSIKTLSAVYAFFKKGKNNIQSAIKRYNVYLLYSIHLHAYFTEGCCRDVLCTLYNSTAASFTTHKQVAAISHCHAHTYFQYLELDYFFDIKHQTGGNILPSI